MRVPGLSESRPLGAGGEANLVPAHQLAIGRCGEAPGRERVDREKWGLVGWALPFPFSVPALDDFDDERTKKNGVPAVIALSGG